MLSELHDKERFKLGIIFDVNPVWMGGVTYFINLIKTINFLSDKDKPEIFLFYRAELEQFVNQINYPYIKVVAWSFPLVYRGYIQSWLTRKNIFVSKILHMFELDGLYPVHDFPIKTTTRTKLVSWYADLQHKYYPVNFSRIKIIERNTRIKFMLMNSRELVVSSQTVADDFAKFYKLPRTLNLHIFHFVSVVEESCKVDVNEVKVRYGLPAEYFMVSNQFHKHKNHRILFQALALLKGEGIIIPLAVTGRLPNDINSPYIKEMNRLIENNKLQNQVYFLGVIPREEQLLLMRYSQAVIQPSLFEGWSTVIEDAMSLRVPVIASNIPVNVEQLGASGTYFDPSDYQKLAEILKHFHKRNVNDIPHEDYSERIKMAAWTFMNIFKC